MNFEKLEMLKKDLRLYKDEAKKIDAQIKDVNECLADCEAYHRHEYGVRLEWLYQERERVQLCIESAWQRLEKYKLGDH